MRSKRTSFGALSPEDERSWRRWLAPLAVISMMGHAGCGKTRETPAVGQPSATPAARKALGFASDYAPESLDADQIEEVRTSHLARRKLAWEAVAKALRPVATNAAGLTVPAWSTWYARDDQQRLFHELYANLGKDGRQERRPFAAGAMAAAEAWNTHMVDALPSWPEDRYATWLATVDDGTRASSLVGLNRTLFAPATVRHILGNYGEIARCLDTVGNVPFAEPGRAPDNFTRCFAAEFPAAAAVVKPAWVRVGFGFKVGDFDTSAEGLARRLAPGGSWETPEREADPGPAEIHTLELDHGASGQGARFRLGGLHLMTKELREWLWITLWWSATPDEDFGEDRPESIRALGGPWANYKMCVAVAYDEAGAIEPELQDRFPSLAAALAVAQAAVGPSSWCSNPFIEDGADNQRSNCIGCHQHAGSAFAAEDVLTGETRFPRQGRARVRENFPADYLWSFAKDPERWGPYIRSQIDYFDVYDRTTETPGRRGTR